VGETNQPLLSAIEVRRQVVGNYSPIEPDYLNLWLRLVIAILK
jgi:hypothetical protein